MQMKNLAVLVLPFALAACSGSKSGSSGSALPGGFGNSIEAQFIDAPVKGLEVVSTSNPAGKTRAQGKFNCKKGEEVEFKLKGLALGKASCGDQIFVQDLFSDVSGYTWENAAAVIQSFAVASGDDLDLDSVTIPDNHLSAIDLGTGFDDNAVAAALNAPEVVYPQGVAKNPVPAATAATAANTYVANNISISDELQSIYSSFSSVKKLYAKRLATGSDYCWNGITVEAKITNSSGINKFEITGGIGFDDSDYVPGDTCTGTPESEGECEDFPVNFIPGKIITTNSVSLMTRKDVDGTQISAVITLAAQGKVEGTYVIDTTDEDGKKAICYYSVSDQPYDIVDDNNGEGDEDDYPLAAKGFWEEAAPSTCTSDFTVGEQGVSVGKKYAIDYVLSYGELGQVVGYTEGRYEGANWIIFQQFEDGTFKATFKSPTDFTYVVTRSVDNATCSGTFVPGEDRMPEL